MPKILSNKIIFGPDDWLDGLNSQFNQGGLISGNSLANSSAFYPYRPLGIAAPGLSSADCTNVTVVSGVIKAGLTKFNSGGLTKAILIAADGEIHELTFSNNTLTNNATYPHTITGSSPVGEDLVSYTDGGTKYIFYSYRNSTKWDIGRLNPATDAFSASDSYMGTGLGGTYHTDGLSYPHPMIINARDRILIGDRHFVHEFDGGTSTWSAAVLTLPRGYIITAFAKIRDHTVVFAYREDLTDSQGATLGEATAFFWDNLSLDPYDIKDLDDNYVSSAFSWRGTVGCFTTGRPKELWSANAKTSDLRIFNGSEFESVASFDGALPLYRGVDVSTDEIQWNSAGVIHSYGTRIPGRPNKLNKIGIAGAGSSSGFLKTSTNSKQYISAGTSSSGGLRVFETGYSAASLTTIYVRPEFPPGQKGLVKAVDLYLFNAGTAGQGQLTVNLKYFGGTNGEQTIVSSTDNFSELSTRYQEDTSGNDLSDFTMLGCELSWTGGTDAPRVESIVVHYEPINV